MAITWLCLMVMQVPEMVMGGPPIPDQEAVNIQAMTLRIEIVPAEKSIIGHAELQVSPRAPRPQLTLDLHQNYKVSAVHLNGTGVPFQREDHRLIIRFPTPQTTTYRLLISYAGAPPEPDTPPWQGGFTWSKASDGTAWIGVTTQNMGGGAWFPAKDRLDDKIDRLDLFITVPEPLVCAANGLLRSIERLDDSKREFHWQHRYPIATYNVSLNIGNYRVDTLYYGGQGGYPIHFYALRHRQADDQTKGDTRSYEEQRRDLLAETVTYLDFYSKKFGPYPFAKEKMGIAHIPYLGMEHQTIVAYGNHFKLVDDYDWLMLHELGHEWWGNKIAASQWRHFWLQEGLCTYSTGMFLEERFGLNRALTFFADMNANLHHKHPLVPKQELNSKSGYHRDVYYKGARVMHALRFLIGKDALDRILYQFANDPQSSYVKTTETDRLKSIIDRETGLDLSWFYDIYLHRAKPPKLLVRKKTAKLTLTWQPRSFVMPIELNFGSEQSPEYQRFAMPRGKVTIPLKPGQNPKIDPRGWLVMETSVR